MIWGLGAEDELLTRSRVNSAHPQTTRGPHQQQGGAPPKAQIAVKSTISHAIASTEPRPTMTDSRAAPLNGQARAAPSYQNFARHQFHGNGAVHSVLPRAGPAFVINDVAALRSRAEALELSLADDVLRQNHGLGLDWRSPFVPGCTASLSVGRGHVHSLPNRLQATASTFIPSHHASQISSDRGDLESRSIQNSHSPVPRRLSAIEIAQHFHKEQSLCGLPTPPSSSAPPWSPQFTSQQILTPSLGLSRPLGQSNTRLERLPPQLLRDPHQLRRDGLHDPPIYLKPQTSSASEPFHETTINLHSSTFKQHTPKFSLPLSKSIRDRRFTTPVQVSPSVSHPVPPPNTPLSLAPARDSKSYLAFPTINPPSPMSPEPHIRTVLHQHPRSVPLARLIQRRLSAVPEEDPNRTSDTVSPSPIPPTNQAEATDFEASTHQPVPLRATGRSAGLRKGLHARNVASAASLSNTTSERDPNLPAGPEVVTVNVRLPSQRARIVNVVEEPAAPTAPSKSEGKAKARNDRSKENVDKHWSDSPTRSRSSRRKRVRRPRAGLAIKTTTKA
jgi:hypothetical protein